MSNQPRKLHVPGQAPQPALLPLKSPGVHNLEQRSISLLQQHLKHRVDLGRVNPDNEAAMEEQFRLLARDGLGYQRDALVGMMAAASVDTYYEEAERRIPSEEWKLRGGGQHAGSPKDVFFVVATMDDQLRNELVAACGRYYKRKRTESQS